MYNNAKEISALAEEIKSRGVKVSAELADYDSHGHIYQLHVGLTDEQLINRQRDEDKTVSTFFDNNTLSVCLYEFFSDSYACKQIAKWLLESDEDEKEFEYFHEEYVGKILLPNGALKKVDEFRLVFRRKGDYEYRNVNTGLPFDIKNAYPVLNK